MTTFQKVTRTDIITENYDFYYALLKSAFTTLISGAVDMDPNIDYDSHPEYLDGSFWQSSPFTFFVYCPFDVTLGGLHRGEGLENKY